MAPATLGHIFDSGAATALTLTYIVWDTYTHVRPKKKLWWRLPIGGWALLQVAFVVLFILAQQHYLGQLPPKLEERFGCMWRATCVLGISIFEVARFAPLLEPPQLSWCRCSRIVIPLEGLIGGAFIILAWFLPSIELIPIIALCSHATILVVAAVHL
ncbi:hypothetical protein TOPH_08331 [Tolypocladium ophioglossoides CBS 100239]|uniref:Uncharacterized protein n=1 Tax=Tolypocladium ophioglossoides (strain CBS 100239) TaxID=1163406 RepID=A0A0L0MYZ0_TOLOC|nr:hypothetical protein TOPH_08331 [Tolypocladium ophioglossoides CBS 100239]